MLVKFFLQKFPNATPKFLSLQVKNDIILSWRIGNRGWKESHHKNIKYNYIMKKLGYKEIDKEYYSLLSSYAPN